jgi:TM2 domain-containing membrane protein YozV
MNNYKPKSVQNAYWLWLAGFFGCLGFHRFYLKKNKTAILWICTAGFFGIGAIADLFAMKWLVKRYNLIEKMKALQTELDQTVAWKERFTRAQRFEEAVAKHDKELLLQEEISILRKELALNNGEEKNVHAFTSSQVHEMNE